MIKTAVMGYGTIGSGVAEILDKNRDVIASQAGQEVELKYVLDLREFPDSPVADKIVHDFKVIEQDEEVKIVVETMGGLNPAYPFVKACLMAGKHVVTSNKALVAAHGTELLAIARKKHVNFFFEASVGGGIPIIRPLYRCLMGERIEEITGILNGTTNFILTKMDKEGESFENALKEAQNLGYAERNPEADVEGYDACRKIAILSSLAFDKQVDYQDIYTEGITKITTADIRYAKALGMTIKLLAYSRKLEGHYFAMVAPFLLGPNDPLYSVNGVFNAIFVHGNVLGDAMFYGSGAGKLPTASAVVADVVDEVMHQGETIPVYWGEEKLTLDDLNDSRRRFLVRVKGDAASDLAAVEAVFGHVDPVSVPELTGEFAFVTGVISEAEYKEKAEKLGTVISRIRVRHLHA